MAAPRALAVLTGLVVLLTSAMSLIRDDSTTVGRAWCCSRSPPPAATWRPCRTTRCCVSSRRRRHRAGYPDSVWAQGYFGSVVLLLIVYFGFIAGDGDDPRAAGHARRRRPERARGDADGGRVVRRCSRCRCSSRRLTGRRPERPAQAVGCFGAYRKLWSEIVGEWRRDRNVVYYLLASAVFRDGLTGVFTFGAVLGVSVYGISHGRRAAVRRERQRDGRRRRGARRAARRPAWAPSPSSSARWRR